MFKKAIEHACGKRRPIGQLKVLRHPLSVVPYERTEAAAEQLAGRPDPLQQSCETIGTLRQKLYEPSPATGPRNQILSVEKDDLLLEDFFADSGEEEKTKPEEEESLRSEDFDGVQNVGCLLRASA